MIMNMSFYFNFKVYDRLQPLGITTSHCVMLRAQKQIGGHFNTQLVKCCPGRSEISYN